MLLELLANDFVNAEDVTTIADCLLEIVATIEQQRDLAVCELLVPLEA